MPDLRRRPARRQPLAYRRDCLSNRTLLDQHAFAREGNYQEAHAAVTQALDDIRATGERMWESEIHRVHGLVLLEENKLAESDAAFSQALGLAREQQAKSLELRAATSQARLWGEQGRRAEAKELLAPVYG